VRNKFESPDWHDAVAGIIASTKAGTTASGMITAIESVVEHEGTCLIAFHNDARPMVLHHTLEPAGRKHYLERYLAGPYLLDPLCTNLRFAKRNRPCAGSATNCLIDFDRVSTTGSIANAHTCSTKWTI
jgi:hypothetical protein